MSLSFSVVIPTYNRRNELQRSIASALAQICPGDEIIVVDDGSTDGTENDFKESSSAIRYVRQHNSGAGAARNRGIAECKGELVCFLDSDDEFLPGKIALQRQLMLTHPNLVYSFSNFAASDRVGALHNNYLANWNNDPRSWTEILGEPGIISCMDYAGGAPVTYHIGDMAPVEFQGAYILTSTVAVRRTLAGDALRFAEDVRTYEDLECFGRLSLAGLACYIDTELSIQHGQAADRLSARSPLDQAESHLKIIRRVWGENARFQKDHFELYRRVERAATLQYAAELITTGQTSMAREALSTIPDAPLKYRLISALPNKVAEAVTRGALLCKASLAAGWEQLASLL